MPDIEKFTLFIYVSIAVLCSGIQLSYLERVWCFRVLFLSFCGGPRAAFCPITEANTFWRLHPVSLNLRTHCGSGLRRSPGPWVGAGDSPLHSPQVTLPLAPGSFLAGLCGSIDEGMKGPPLCTALPLPHWAPRTPTLSAQLRGAACSSGRDLLSSLTASLLIASSLRALNIW